MQVFHGSNVRVETIENKDFLFAVEDITDSIISFFIENSGISESAAIKTFFSTNLYEQLATEDTMLWKKSWQEIYEMFKEELKI